MKLRTPDYQTPCGRAKLYRGDCLAVLAALPTASADAVVTDPPYCSGGFSEAGKAAATHQGLRSETIQSGRKKWFAGDNMTTQGICALMRAVAIATPLAPTGSLLTFTDWRMLSALGPAMESAGLRLRNVLVWNKGTAGLGRGFRAQHEMIMHFSARRAEFYENRHGNVLSYPRPSKRDRQHPTEKPVALLSDLIETVAPPGGLVLDPFTGSATTGAAALATGRRFIGVEADPEIFDTAAERLALTAACLLAA